MKKTIIAFTTFFMVGFAIAQQIECSPQWVCSNGNCKFVTICK